MDVQATVQVPKLIYDIYAAAAKDLGDFTVERVMFCALQAYVQGLFREMQANGELTDDLSAEQSHIY